VTTNKVRAMTADAQPHTTGTAHGGPDGYTPPRLTAYGRLEVETSGDTGSGLDLVGRMYFS
jgi:hypothetical protein